MGPKNYTSSLVIRTTCTTLKWVSKYDFIFEMKNFLFKNHLHSRFARINPKKIRILSIWTEECLNIARVQEPTYISQTGIKKLFYIFKPIIPLLPNNLRSRLVKLGPKMTRSWEKRGPRSTRLLRHSGPRVQLSNVYLDMISSLEMKNLSFQKSPSFGINQNQP
jgi:hypothetical protein